MRLCVCLHACLSFVPSIPFLIQMRSDDFCQCGLTLALVEARVAANIGTINSVLFESDLRFIIEARTQANRQNEAGSWRDVLWIDGMGRRVYVCWVKMQPTQNLEWASDIERRVVSFGQLRNISLPSLSHIHTDGIFYFIHFGIHFFSRCGWKKCSVLLRGKVIPFLQLIFIWFTLFLLPFWFCVVLSLILKQICAIYCPVFSLIQRSLVCKRWRRKYLFNFFFNKYKNGNVNVCMNVERERKKISVQSFFLRAPHSLPLSCCVVSFCLNKVAFVDCIIRYRKMAIKSKSQKGLY